MTAQTISPEERIRELSTISEDVARMLGSAGNAINALTTRSVQDSRASGDGDVDMRDNDGANNTPADPDGDSLESHKEAFATNAKAYYVTLQSVIARLRRQTFALEEAGIISKDKSLQNEAMPKPPPQATPKLQQSNLSAADLHPVIPEKQITNGGLGNFDVGWLNSRGNKVAIEKEAELVKEAQELLQTVLAKDKIEEATG